MNSSRKNYGKGTFTSNGFVEKSKVIEYETVKNHSGMALLVFLVPAAGLVMYIANMF